MYAYFLVCVFKYVYVICWYHVLVFYGGFWLSCLKYYKNAPVPIIYIISIIFFDDLPFIFVVFRCCRLQRIVFCLYWVSNCVIFKPASITDFTIAFVFSSSWFYYPLSITDCDLNANVAILKTLLEQIKILTISYPPSTMQIMKLSIFQLALYHFFRLGIHFIK